MNDPTVMTYAQQWANDVLVWVGFGTLVGLLAKAIMPGRDPGGAVATLSMGIAGTIIGCGTLTYFWEGHRVTPISVEGFVVATAGAFCLLGIYRLLGGHWAGGTRRVRVTTPRPHRTRRRAVEHVIYEDD